MTSSHYLLRLADDRLVLGHRLSEWCGHGPILEEDIALANIALGPMERLAPRLAAQHLVTSGYLGRDTPRLAGFRRVERRELEGWAADRSTRL